jgi:stress response protein SCP2
VLQHCEKLIQKLQICLLEEQQKLAVAVQVDRGKDQAILQLQDAWIRLVQHWKELEEQRHSLAGRLHSEREAHQRQESEMVQVNIID